MKFLLNTQTDLMPLIILAIGVVVSLCIIIGIKSTEKKYTKKGSTKREPKNYNIKLNKEYITKKELAFLNAVHKSLPAEFIAFPKVPLSNLLVPTADKVTYNMVADKIADICVFTKDTMEPILAIDLIENEVSDLIFYKMDELAKKALKHVKVPVLEVKVQENYDLFELRKQLITAMPDKIVTMLKNNIK